MCTGKYNTFCLRMHRFFSRCNLRNNMPNPCGICVSSLSGEIFVSEIRDFFLNIHVFDSAGAWKKKGYFKNRRPLCSEPRLMADGKIAVSVRSDNAIYLFDSMN